MVLLELDIQIVDKPQKERQGIILLADSELLLGYLRYSLHKLMWAYHTFEVTVVPNLSHKHR